MSRVAGYIQINIYICIHICMYVRGCQCNERLKANTDGSTCLTYTGLHGELEHLKVETRLIGETMKD